MAAIASQVKTSNPHTESPGAHHPAPHPQRKIDAFFSQKQAKAQGKNFQEALTQKPLFLWLLLHSVARAVAIEKEHQRNRRI